MTISLDQREQIVKINSYTGITNTILTIGPSKPCYTGFMYRGRPSRAELSHLSPQALEDLLVIARAEVTMFYDLYQKAPNGATRQAAKKGYKNAYIQGCAYIYCLKKHGVEALPMERPQIEILEQLTLEESK